MIATIPYLSISPVPFSAFQTMLHFNDSTKYITRGDIVFAWLCDTILSIPRHVYWTMHLSFTYRTCILCVKYNFTAERGNRYIYLFIWDFLEVAKSTAACILYNLTCSTMCYPNQIILYDVHLVLKQRILGKKCMW